MKPSMQGKRVGLFVTCIVDLFRPSIGFASVRLLEAAGCEVVVPEMQTCCGQPAWNSGDRPSTREIAFQMLQAFRDVDYVVAPSGSCTGMLRQYTDVIERADPRWQEAEALAGKCFELTEFLVDVCGFEAGAAVHGDPVTYHDSCAGLRECGVKAQPRVLLQQAGVEVKEMAAAEVCCGFGGTFCIKYPEVSAGMVDDKIASIEASGAETVVGGDLGCLLNIAGRLSRDGKPVIARHVAEVLAGDPNVPALGRGEGAS